MNRIYISYSCGKICNISINSDLGKIVIANYAATIRCLKGYITGVSLGPSLKNKYGNRPGQRGYLAENHRAYSLVASRLSRDWIKPRMSGLGES